MTVPEVIGQEYLITRLVLLGVVITNIAFGIYVYSRNPKNLPNRMYAGFAGSIALWTIGIVFIRTAGSPPILDRLTFVGAALSITFLLALLKSFPQGARFGGQWDLALFVTGGVVMALLSFSPLVYREAVIHNGIHQGFYGPLYPVFGAYVLGCFIVCVATLWWRYQRATGLARLQLQYVLVGVIVPVAASVTTNLVFPLFFGTSVLSNYGPLSTIPMIGVIAHAIIRHRLMDIRVIVRHGTVYALTGVVLAAPAVALVVAVGIWVPSAAGKVVLDALIVGAVAILAAPLRNCLDGVFNAYVYRERYNYHETVREATQRLAQLQPINTLLIDLCGVVERAVRPEGASLWLPVPDIAGYRMSVRRGRQLDPQAGTPDIIAETSPLAGWLSLHRQLLLRDDRAPADPGWQGAVAELSSLGAQIAVPIGADRGLEGILLIGPKLSGDPYFNEDVALLGALAAEAAVALANARLHQDVVRAREQIEAILETMPSAVVVVNQSGQIEWFNDVAERLTGLPANAVLGRELPASHPFASLIRDTLIDRQARQEEVELPGDSVLRIPLVCSVAPLVGPQGEVRGAVCVGSDLSRVKELEAETRRVERLASFGAMASGIAHEVRNPLVAIKTHFQLLPDGCTCGAQEEQRQFAAVATREIDRIDMLLERLTEMRDFPRTGFSPVNLSEVLADTLLLLQAKLSRDSVTVVRELEADCWVQGDREQLEQLFLNLLVNAKEAVAGRGEITIRCWMRKEDPKRAAIVEISDSGPGIHDAVRETLFEPFVSTKPHGGGLGLAICRAITDAHRATIRASNKARGSGATITVEFRVEAQELSG